MLDLNELTARCGPCQTTFLEHAYRKQLVINLQKVEALKEVLARELTSLGVEQEDDPESTIVPLEFTSENLQTLGQPDDRVYDAQQPSPESIYPPIISIRDHGPGDLPKLCENCPNGSTEQDDAANHYLNEHGYRLAGVENSARPGPGPGGMFYGPVIILSHRSAPRE